MKTFTYTITDPIGIHARPAGNLVRSVKDYECEITISGNGRTADCKKLMSVMKLGVRMGQDVTLTFDGADEEEACTATEAYMKENI